MYMIFVYEEGVLMGTETITETDLNGLRDYLHRQGYITEVEKLHD